MGHDRLTADLEMDHLLTRLHDITSPDVADAARTMLAAADQLDELHDRMRRNPVDFDLGYQLVAALVDGGYYREAEIQFAAALGLEFFEGDWETDDFRALIAHILREGA
jgi:hypothetical protein